MSKYRVVNRSVLVDIVFDPDITVHVSIGRRVDEMYPFDESEELLLVEDPSSDRVLGITTGGVLRVDMSRTLIGATIFPEYGMTDCGL
jgi:hypothetical protein